MRTDAFRRLEADRCPSEGDDWRYFSTDIPLRRHCAGGRQLQLVGFLVEQEAETCRDGRAYSGEPPWLAEYPCTELVSAVGDAVTGLATRVHVHPDANVAVRQRADAPIRVRVTGHFDDPASTECVREPITAEAPELVPPEPELWCRQQFVATSIVQIE